MPLSEQMLIQAMERYAVERVRYLMLADAVEQRVRGIVRELRLRARLHSSAMPLQEFETTLTGLMESTETSRLIDSVDGLFDFVSDLASLQVLPFCEADRRRIVDEIANVFGEHAMTVESAEPDSASTTLRLTLPEADCKGPLVRLQGLFCKLTVNSLFSQLMDEIQQELGSGEGGRVAGPKMQAGLRGLVQLTGRSQIALRKLVSLAGSEPFLPAEFDAQAKLIPQTRQLLPDNSEAEKEQPGPVAPVATRQTVTPVKRAPKTKDILPDRTVNAEVSVPQIEADSPPTLSGNEQPTPPREDETGTKAEQFLHIDDFIRSMDSLVSLPRDPLSRRELYNELLACELQNRAAIIEILLSGNWRERSEELIERFNEYAERHALEIRLGQDEQLTALLTSRCSRRIMGRVDKKLQKRKPRRLATIVMIMDKLS